MGEVVKVLIRVGDVPNNSPVTKRTGSVEYLVRDQIKVYHQGGDRQEITATGSRFLVNPRTGDAHAIGNDVEVLWLVRGAQVDALLDIIRPEDSDTDSITEVNVAPLYANDLHLRDHTLPKGERCWITCGPASISINSTDEGVIVDVWPARQEDQGMSVASMGVMYDELED